MCPNTEYLPQRFKPLKKLLNPWLFPFFRPFPNPQPRPQSHPPGPSNPITKKPKSIKKFGTCFGAQNIKVKNFLEKFDESSDGGESTLVRLKERLAREQDDGVICELERDVDGIHRRRMEKELK